MNIASAKINCEKDIVTIGLEGMSHEFNFAKFRRQPRDRQSPSKDEIIGLASIVVPPNVLQNNICSTMKMICL